MLEAAAGVRCVSLLAAVCFLCLERLRDRAVDGGAVAGFFCLLADLDFLLGVFVLGVFGVDFFCGDDFRLPGEDSRGLPTFLPLLVERLFDLDLLRDFDGLFFFDG